VLNNTNVSLTLGFRGVLSSIGLETPDATRLLMTANAEKAHDNTKVRNLDGLRRNSVMDALTDFVWGPGNGSTAKIEGE